ncbi:TPA: hypothetical protein HA244_04625 [Candidatus Micrarchaeota archaeon]|nr:hypothetical protein [Candidatus Micrarchaeota archaeon]
MYEESPQAEGKKFPLIPFFAFFALIAVALYLFSANYPKILVQPSVSPTPPGETGFQTVSYIGSERYLYLGSSSIKVEHNAVITEKGKTEQYFFTNQGEQPVSFRAVLVAESEFNEGDGLWLADRLLGVKFVVKNLTLNPGDSAQFEYKTPATQNVGIMILAITDPAVNLDELRQILEQQVSGGEIRLLSLRVDEVDGVADRIEKILNDKNVQDKAAELRNEIKGLDFMSIPKTSDFFASVTESTPVAFFKIPVFFNATQAGGGRLLFAVGGDLSPYLAAGYPKETRDENLQYVELLFDFRKTVKDYRLDFASLQGSLEISHSLSPDEKISFSLKVEAESDYAKFLRASPSSISFVSNGGKSLGKPAFIVNNLPFAVSVPLCGKKLPVPRFGASEFQATLDCVGTVPQLLVATESDERSFESIYGTTPLAYRLNSFKAAFGFTPEAVQLPWKEDSIAPIYDGDVSIDGSGSCSGGYCSCLARMDALQSFKNKLSNFAEFQNERLPPQALLALYGAQFNQSTVVRTSQASCSFEEKEFSFASKPGSVFLVTASAPLTEENGIEYSKLAISARELLPQYSYAVGSGLGQDKEKFIAYGSWPV